jgi:hypothetical protein
LYLASIASYLAGKGVEFVVVGGCAQWLRGEDHRPADLDLVPEPSPRNLRTLFEALSALGTIGTEWRPTDHALATRDVVTRVTPVGSIDVLLRAGRDDYASLAGRATKTTIENTLIMVAARA